MKPNLFMVARNMNEEEQAKVLKSFASLCSRENDDTNSIMN